MVATAHFVVFNVMRTLAGVGPGLPQNDSVQTGKCRSRDHRS